MMASLKILGGGIAGLLVALASQLWFSALFSVVPAPYLVRGLSASRSMLKDLANGALG